MRVFVSNKGLIHTKAFRDLIGFPPCADPGFECATGDTGTEDANFILVVNRFVSENVLGMKDLSCDDGEPAFVSLILKFSLGRMPLYDGLLDDGLEGTFVLEELGAVGRFSLLGVELGPRQMLIFTESSAEELSRVLSG